MRLILVDLDQVPEGELSVRQTGIQHHRPTIEPKWNPHNAVQEIADQLRENIVRNFTEHVETVLSE